MFPQLNAKHQNNKLPDGAETKKQTQQSYFKQLFTTDINVVNVGRPLVAV